MSKEMRKYIDEFKNLITENKMEKIFNYWLTSNYDSVEPIESDDKISFMKNGIEDFTYYKKYKGPTLSHHVRGGFMWNFFD